jgi:hypothetical protein
MNPYAYAIAADIVIAVHFCWILFLIGGVLIGRRTRWVRALTGLQRAAPTQRLDLPAHLP